MLALVLVFGLVLVTEGAGPPDERFAQAAEAMDSIPPVQQLMNVSPAVDIQLMLDAFGQRDYPEYIRHFADDYVFTSDNPQVCSDYPMGMSLDDEREYSGTLLREPGAREFESTRPYATRISLEYGRIHAEQPLEGDSLAHVVVDKLRAVIELSDSSTYVAESSRHEITLAKRGWDWAIVRWVESHPDSVAGSGIATRAPDAGIPANLGLIAAPRPRDHQLTFDVALPREGGVLEMFDVQGRRVALRELSGLRPGYHRVSFDGGSLSAGIYFARLRQAGTAVTAKVVWAR